MVADRPLPAALLPCSSNPLIPPHPHTARSLLRVRGMPARQRRRADPLGVCRGGAVAGCAARSLGCCRSVAVALFPDGQAWLFYSRPKPYKLLLPHCCYRLAACRRGRDPGQPLEHQRPQPGHRVRANDERPGCVCVWGGGWVRCVCGAVQWVCDAVPLLGDEDCCMCPSPVRCAAGARPLPMRTAPHPPIPTCPSRLPTCSTAAAERRERHRQNYMHVTIHTAQTWADTFISELNDTHVEAELRTRNIPPPLNLDSVIAGYSASRRRLLVLGYNATLTTAVEAPRQPKKHFDQIQASGAAAAAAAAGWGLSGRGRWRCAASCLCRPGPLLAPALTLLALHCLTHTLLRSPLALACCRR